MRRLGMMAALAAGIAGMAAAETHKGYEMPPYRVEATEGGYELRDYGSHLVAEVTVAGDRSTAVSRGFSALAGYIFGGNAEGAKIAMTVPVAQTPAGAETWTVRFMMPAAWTEATLPAPKDARIRFVEVAPERQVAERFSGIPQTADLARRAGALRAWAEGRGMRVTAGPHYYFYDAPMTLPWRRRNEVAFTVAP